MVSIRGRFEQGVARPEQHVEGRDGQAVLITFLEASEPSSAEADNAWSEFDELIEACQVETGIPDLAHQHDHYIHGTPKRD